jgi:LPS sulfotransferase NodH
MNTIEEFLHLPNHYIERNILNVLRYDGENNAFRTLQNKFCIACTARSGSSFLTIALERYHLDVREYFNTHGFIKEIYETQGVNTLSQFSTYLVTHHAPNQVFGVKCPYSATATYATLGELPTFTKEWKVIFLTRNNVLRQAISAQIASLTNQWTNVMTSQYDINESDYDFKKILGLMNSIVTANANWERFFSVLGVVPHRISYENLTKKTVEELENIANFLGIDPKRFPESRSHVPWIRTQTTTINQIWEERFLEDVNGKMRSDYAKLSSEEFLNPMKESRGDT